MTHPLDEMSIIGGHTIEKFQGPQQGRIVIDTSLPEIVEAVRAIERFIRRELAPGFTLEIISAADEAKSQFMLKEVPPVVRHIGLLLQEADQLGIRSEVEAMLLNAVKDPNAAASMPDDSGEASGHDVRALIQGILG